MRIPRQPPSNSPQIRPPSPLGGRSAVLYGGVMPVFTNPRRMPCFGIAPTLEDFEAIAAEAAGDDSRGVPEACRQRAHPDRRLPVRRGREGDGPRHAIRPARPLSGRVDDGAWRGPCRQRHRPHLPLSPADPRLLVRIGRGPAAHRAPRADPRDRPSLRAERRRHGSDRSQGRGRITRGRSPALRTHGGRYETAANPERSERDHFLCLDRSLATLADWSSVRSSIKP